METKQLLEAVETIRVVRSLFDSTPSPWVPVVAAIGGALVGGVSTIIPSYFLDQRKRRDERVFVSTALIAEVSGMLAIVRQREYVDNLKRTADHLRATPGATLRFSVKIPAHYSRVYQAYVDRLGSIDAGLAAKVIEFHQLIECLVQDVAPGGLIADEGGSVRAFDQLVAISEKALEIGKHIVEQGKVR